MITWSDIPLGWSIIAHYGPDGHICGFGFRRGLNKYERCTHSREEIESLFQKLGLVP